jgi:hypothetical protein
MNADGITSEQILQMPELAHLYEAVRFLEGKDGRDLFPRKYQESMLSLAERDAYALFKKNPNLPIKEVLVRILDTYPSDIRGDILLKMTQRIIEEWTELLSKVHQTTHELEPA